jgi:hypothetical protein
MFLKLTIMKKLFNACIYFVCLFLVAPVNCFAQEPEVKSSSHGNGLFETDKILDITISGNVKDLLNDRSDKPKDHPMNILYKAEGGAEISLTAVLKTRGHFRKLKENCYYPPLEVHFTKNEALKSSIFKGQKKLKLVMPCAGDEYVVREWMVYKLYNLITPKSFMARLVKVTLNNTKSNKTESPFYGILLEDENQMAKRNGGISVTRKMQPNRTEPNTFLTMAVFEYLVGNTDWSVQYMQNIKLVAADSMAVPFAVAYDFDHAGIVNAPYAMPAEELRMSSVLERRYRGYCIEDMKIFDPVIALYNKLKPAIYSIYTDCALLDKKYLKATLKYLDEFYETINDPQKVQKEFGYPCDKNGTGNIVIKGLRED